MARNQNASMKLRMSRTTKGLSSPISIGGIQSQKNKGLKSAQIRLFNTLRAPSEKPVKKKAQILITKTNDSQSANEVLVARFAM